MPAYGNFILDKGYDADEALVKYRAVKAGASAESVQAVDSAGEIGIGVVQHDVTAAEILQGKGASVRELGITEWEAGAAITRGQHVTVDGDGKCIPSEVGKVIWGEARQTCDAEGDRISVTLYGAKITAEVVS